MAHNATRANGNAADGDPFHNTDDGRASRNGHHRDESPWSPGELLAHDLDADPDTPIRDVVDRDAWESFRTFRKRYAVPITDETTFADLSAVWPVAWHACGLDAPTHTEVAEFLADYAYPLTDPLEAGAHLEAERRKRFADKDRVTAALKPVGIHGATEYTLTEVERACGAEVAGRALIAATRHNRMTWSAIKPHRLTERTDLVTAAELVTDYGVEAATVASMTAATADEKLDALERLGRARKHYAKFGAAEEISVAAGMVSPTEMMTKSPPRQLLGHLIYEAQLAELIGEPGSGKTFVAVGIALSLAAGRNLGTHHVTERVRVLYVAAEAPESVYLRALGWWFHHGIDPQTQDGWFTVYPEPLQLGDPEHMRQVVRYATDNGVGLVVFDTRALVTLGLDENSSGDQGLAIESCKALNRAGTAVLVVHHTPKDGSVGGGGRGSGAWFGAAYTSMYLTQIDRRDHLVCDKTKDRAAKCKHPLDYADDVILPATMMPEARSEEERSTRALTTVDPFSADHGLGAHGLNATQLSTLYVVATLADADGLTGAKLASLAESSKTDGHDIGKRPTIFKSLKALRGEMPGSRGVYVKTVKTTPATSYRASDAGWDLLVSEGMVTQDYADSRRHTVEDVGQQPNRDAVANIRAALDHLTDEGAIIPRVSTMTDAKRLVVSYMAAKGQPFGDVPWSEAHAAWKDSTDE